METSAWNIGDNPWLRSISFAGGVMFPALADMDTEMASSNSRQGIHALWNPYFLWPSILHPSLLSITWFLVQLSYNCWSKHSVIPLGISIRWQWVNAEYIIHRIRYTLSAAYINYSIHQLQHTLSTSYTKYTIHQEQHTPRTAHTKHSIHHVRYRPSTAHAVHNIYQVRQAPSTRIAEYRVHAVQHTVNDTYRMNSIRCEE